MSTLKTPITVVKKEANSLFNKTGLQINVVDSFKFNNIERLLGFIWKISRKCFKNVVLQPVF